MFETGRMTQRITLQANTPTADGAGGLVASWADFASVPEVWAEVTPIRGTSGVQDGAYNATGIWRFRIRNRDDVSELDRLVWRGDVYAIVRVERGGPRPLYLDIIGERGVPQ